VGRRPVLPPRRLGATRPQTPVPGAHVRVADEASAIRDDNLADLTLVGNLDIADENAPIVVDAGQVLVVVWTNTTPGAIYTARIQYRVLARV
jgi:hypothetical protein